MSGMYFVCLLCICFPVCTSAPYTYRLGCNSPFSCNAVFILTTTQVLRAHVSAHSSSSDKYCWSEVLATRSYATYKASVATNSTFHMSIASFGSTIHRLLIPASSSPSRTNITKFNIREDDVGIGSLTLDDTGNTRSGGAGSTCNTRLRCTSISGIVAVKPQHMGSRVIPKAHHQYHPTRQSSTHLT